MKPMLKAPGNTRLKLNHDELLSRRGFNFNLRHYSAALKEEGVIVVVSGRVLHSIPFQLNLSSSVHRITQVNS